MERNVDFCRRKIVCGRDLITVEFEQSSTSDVGNHIQRRREAPRIAINLRSTSHYTRCFLRLQAKDDSACYCPWDLHPYSNSFFLIAFFSLLAGFSSFNCGRLRSLSWSGFFTESKEFLIREGKFRAKEVTSSPFEIDSWNFSSCKLWWIWLV